MHKLLSLWKEQSGKGSVEFSNDEDAIRMLEVAINALSDKPVCVVVPPTKYYHYRRYFPNNILKWSDVTSLINKDYKLHSIFVIDAEDMPDRLVDVFKDIPFKYILCTCTKFDKLNQYFKDKAPLINFKNTTHSEYNYVVPMSFDVQERYDNIVVKMKDILSLFRDYNNITGCIAGNNQMSASAFRDKFAADNGWSRELNTAIPMFAEIDKYYNPNNLYDQATLYNKLVMERDKVIAKSADKIASATATAIANATKQIIILAKGDDTCEEIANSLKKAKVKAEAVHANTTSRSLNDDKGKPIKVKTGAYKGSVKTFGTKSVNDALLSQFNARKLRVIVSTGTIDKSSKLIGVDLIIMVSPKATNYYELKSRIEQLTFNNNAITIINTVFDIDKDLAIIHRKQGELCVNAIDVFNLHEIIM